MKNQQINQIVTDFIALHKPFYADSLRDQYPADVWSRLEGGSYGEVTVDDEGWSQIEVPSHCTKSGNPVIFEYEAPTDGTWENKS
jgi:hypothetical protein